MNENVLINWECTECKTVNQCTIGKALEVYQKCEECGARHDVNVKIIVEKC